MPGVAQPTTMASDSKTPRFVLDMADLESKKLAAGTRRDCKMCTTLVACVAAHRAPVIHRTSADFVVVWPLPPGGGTAG